MYMYNSLLPDLARLLCVDTRQPGSKTTTKLPFVHNTFFTTTTFYTYIVDRLLLVSMLKYSRFCEEKQLGLPLRRVRNENGIVSHLALIFEWCYETKEANCNDLVPQDQLPQNQFHITNSHDINSRDQFITVTSLATSSHMYEKACSMKKMNMLDFDPGTMSLMITIYIYRAWNGDSNGTIINFYIFILLVIF